MRHLETGLENPIFLIESSTDACLEVKSDLKNVICDKV